MIAGLVAGASYLVGRNAFRRSHQRAAADASGMSAVGDLAHLPPALQQTALWQLSEGGFERRVVRGTFTRSRGDIEVTAFDLETLRERRGEWAYLPIEPPFRIAGVVTVVACQLAADLPHVLLKSAGLGDKLLDDDDLSHLTSGTKLARDVLGLSRKYPADLPPALPATPAKLPGLPDGWRAYTRASDLLGELLSAGLHGELVRVARRDLVIELLGSLVVVYPAAREASGPDALADLVTTALALADAARAISALSPRGVEPRSS